jgi:HlyD family secretion protein
VGALVLAASVACGQVSLPLVQTPSDSASVADVVQATPAAAPTPASARATGPQQVPVRRDTLTETLALDGTIAAASQSTVTSDQRGVVDQVDVKAGQPVKEGDVLVDLDGADISTKLDAARGQLQTAQSNLAQGQTQAQAQQQAAAQKAAADQAQQQQAIANAEIGLKRAQENLAQVQAGKPASVRQAQTTAVASSQQQVQGAQDALNKLLAGPDPVAVSTAQRAVSTAEAAVAKAQSDLDKLTGGPDPSAVRAAQAQVQRAQTQLQVAQNAKPDTKLDPAVGRIQHDQSVQDAQLALQTAQAGLDKVKQPPADTDVQSAQQAVQDAQAAVSGAQAQLAAAQGGPDQATVDAASGAVEGARHKLAESQQALDEVNSHPTPQELADAQDQVRQAQLALASAQQPLPAPADSGGADLDALQQAIDQAQANVSNLEQALDNTHLKAPADGTIVAVRVKPGANVTSSTPVVILAKPGAPVVHVQLDDTQAGQLLPGQQATVQLDAGNATLPPIPAVVATVTPASRDGSNLPSADLQASWSADISPRFGAPVQVVVTVGQKQDVLVVPRNAVRQSGGRATVEVQDGTLRHLVSVQVGITAGDRVEIQSGLSEGQIVLTRAS